MTNIELNNKHHTIYNTYLKQLASFQQRPFSYRKSFDDLDINIKGSLIKMESFFNRNPEINMDIYFKCVFYFMEKNEFIDFNFFSNSMKILKFYKKYQNLKFELPIDSEESKKDFMEGLLFIKEFCEQNNILIKDYCKSKNEYGILWCLNHLKIHKINFYVLHLFKISFISLEFDEDTLNIFVEDFKTKFFTTQKKYLSSSVIKELGDKFYNIIHKTK